MVLDFATNIFISNFAPLKWNIFIYFMKNESSTGMFILSQNYFPIHCNAKSIFKTIFPILLTSPIWHYCTIKPSNLTSPLSLQYKAGKNDILWGLPKSCSFLSIQEVNLVWYKNLILKFMKLLWKQR